MQGKVLIKPYYIRGGIKMMFLKKMFLILTLPILVSSAHAMENGKVKTLFDSCIESAAKIISSDKEIEKFEKGESTYSERFTPKMNKEITKIIFEDYEENNIKSMINEKLAKTLNLDSPIAYGWFSSNNNLVLTGSVNIVEGVFGFHERKVWDVKTGKLLPEFNHEQVPRPNNYGIALSTSYIDRVTKLYNPKTHEEICMFDFSYHQVHNVLNISLDGKVLTNSKDGVVKIWNVNWHKDLTLEQVQLLLLYQKKQKNWIQKTINFDKHKHLNKILKTLPKDLQEMMLESRLSKRSLFFVGSMACMAGIVGFSLWGLLNK